MMTPIQTKQLSADGFCWNQYSDRVATITNELTHFAQVAYFAFDSWDDAHAFWRSITDKRLCTRAQVRESERFTTHDWEVKTWGMSQAVLEKLIDRDRKRILPLPQVRRDWSISDSYSAIAVRCRLGYSPGNTGASLVTTADLKRSKTSSMNTITITFSHPEALAPKYIITDRIAVLSDCQPEAWATGLVVGLHLEEIFSPRWWYICKLDSPLGLTEEYLETGLVPENEIPSLQAEWEQAEANLCPQCDGSGTLDDGKTIQSHTCSSCAGTGIKDYAKTLPPASIKLQ